MILVAWLIQKVPCRSVHFFLLETRRTYFSKSIYIYISEVKSQVRSHTSRWVEQRNISFSTCQLWRTFLPIEWWLGPFTILLWDVFDSASRLPHPSINYVWWLLTTPQSRNRALGEDTRRGRLYTVHIGRHTCINENLAKEEDLGSQI